MTKLFGFPLHREGLTGAKFLGRFVTAQAFPLVIAGRWFAPMMFNEPGKGHHVDGELYEVSEAQLEALDIIEWVPKAGNLRLRVDVRCLETGKRCKAYVYMKARELADDDRRFIPPAQR